jgi:hypothetical protein
MATAQPHPVRDVTRHPIVPLVMAVVATIEVLYEWVAIWRRARRAVIAWWDAAEQRADRATTRDATRWVSGWLERRPTTGRGRPR